MAWSQADLSRNYRPRRRLVKSGQLRALAVTRLADLPDVPTMDVPTMAHAGVQGLEIGLWIGVFARAGTAPAIVKKLETELERIVQLSDVREKFRRQMITTVGSAS